MKIIQVKKAVVCIVVALVLSFVVVVISGVVKARREMDGCTSWVAVGEALSGEKTLLHKNRDMTNSPMVLEVVSNGLNKYLAFTDENDDKDRVYVWGGINEYGLAAASNYVGGVNLFGTIGGPSTCREVLENCDSVESAYNWIEANKSKFSSGNIIFLAEGDMGAVIEVKVWPMGSVSISSREDSFLDGESITITGKPDVDFRSNHYQILSNYSEPQQGDTSYDRYERLITLLTHTPGDAAPGYYGQISVSSSESMSKLFAEPGTNNAFCRDSTLGRMTFEIDGNEPMASTLHYGDAYPCSGSYQEISFDATVSYTFDGIIPGDMDFNIYECDVDRFPFNGSASNRNDMEEPDYNGYLHLSTADNSRWSTDDPGNYDEMMLWVEMTINEAPSDIKQIEFVFYGYSSQSNDFRIYVKKVAERWEDNFSWIQLGTEKCIKSGNDDGIRRILNVNIDQYIDPNGMITWMVGTPEGHSDSLSVNYIKMDVVLN